MILVNMASFLLFIFLDNGDLVNDLNYVQLKIIANAECKTYYGNQFWGTMTCTEGSNYNEGFCFVS
jgi:hypothetical protein